MRNKMNIHYHTHRLVVSDTHKKEKRNKMNMDIIICNLSYSPTSNNVL